MRLRVPLENTAALRPFDFGELCGGDRPVRDGRRFLQSCPRMIDIDEI